MKVTKTFRLSPEAINILNQQPNATQFIESLILNQTARVQNNNPEEIEERMVNLIWEYTHPLEQRIETLESNLGKNNSVESSNCCLNKTVPCKHWKWNGLTEIWENALTGEIRDAR